ncbi:MAG: transcriptional regulator, LysR family [Modestobacter sp.]|nr:transcriptional regulator, LysR family [Modestobacter sp.]
MECHRAGAAPVALPLSGAGLPTGKVNDHRVSVNGRCAGRAHGDRDRERTPQHPPPGDERRAAGGTALEAREAGSGTRRALEEALRTALGAGVALASPAMEFGTATAVREAVRAGLGPAVLSTVAVDADLADGRLVAVRVADLPLTRQLRAVWAGSARLPAGPARDLLGIAALPST